MAKTVPEGQNTSATATSERPTQRFATLTQKRSTSIRKPARRQKRGGLRPHSELITDGNLAADRSRGVRLQVSFSAVDFPGRNHQIQWRDCFVEVPPTMPLHQLPAELKKIVLERVVEDGDLSRRLGSRRYVLDLSMDIRNHGDNSHQGGEVISLDEPARVAQVSDLLLEPTASSERALGVHITLNERRVKLAGAAVEEQVNVPIHIDPADHYRLLRIGYAPIRDLCKDEAIEKRYDGRLNGVAYTQPVLAWIDRRTGGVQLSRVHAYDFDEYCIGDAHESTPWNIVPFSNRYYFLGPLEPVQRRREARVQFLERLQGLMAADGGDDQQLGSGVPFLPTYCYNLYKPELHGMGLHAWPRKDVDVAVTCVNKYDAAGELRDVRFPRDIRLIVTARDERSDIIKDIHEALDCNGLYDGGVVDSAKLFEAKHRGRWELRLWVMPQNGAHKLYRYTEGRLDQFLSSALTVRTMDKRLYLEAHVVSAC